MGKQSNAQNDLLACCRLSSLMAQHPLVLYRLEAKLMRCRAINGLLALFHYGPRNAEQARALDRQVQQIPDLPGLAEAHDVADRYLYLDCAAWWLRGVEDCRNPLDKVVCRAIVNPVMTDWNEVFRVGNTWYDSLNAATRKPKWTERREALSRVEQRAPAMSHGDKMTTQFSKEFPKYPRRAIGRVVAEEIMSLTAPNSSMCMWFEDKATTDEQMLRIASAINVYRAEHGAYPAVGGFDSEVPCNDACRYLLRRLHSDIDGSRRGTFCTARE